MRGAEDGRDQIGKRKLEKKRKCEGYDGTTGTSGSTKFWLPIAGSSTDGVRDPLMVGVI
jgi:hypothetical protein